MTRDELIEAMEIRVHEQRPLHTPVRPMGDQEIADLPVPLSMRTATVYRGRLVIQAQAMIDPAQHAVARKVKENIANKMWSHMYHDVRHLTNTISGELAMIMKPDNSDLWNAVEELRARTRYPYG